MLYADDIVLITSNENDLHILHIRTKRKLQSKFMFLFNKRPVDNCNSYKYLGLTLNEFLDYDRTAEVQAEAAGQAVGTLLKKQ